jgi:hypothetical protein
MVYQSFFPLYCIRILFSKLLDIYIILIGIIFECIEFGLNNISPFIDSKIIEDTIINTIGVLVGIGIYKLYPKKIDLYSLFFI